MKNWVLLLIYFAGGTQTLAASSQDVLTVPATSVNRTSTTPLNVTASGSDFLGSIQLTNGSGSVQMQGKQYELFVYYQSPPWPGLNEVDYQAIASDGADWDVFFIRCGAGKLDWIFYEDIDGAGLNGEAPSSEGLNLCAMGAQGSTQKVAFPAISMESPPPTNEWNITGPNLSYTAGAGGDFNASNGVNYRVYPFTTVDCTKCETPGWYELHSLFYDPAAQELCFGIIYLHPDAGKMNIGYSLCLPDLSSPLDGDVLGTFSGPLSVTSLLPTSSQATGS